MPRSARRLAAAALLMIAAAAPATAAPKRLYLGSDDHTDYMWSATDAQYQDYFVRALDEYLDQIDATENDGDYVSRFNTDGTLWIQTYERRKTPAEFNRLMERVKDGSIGMPLNTLVSVHGGTPFEGIIRDYYYAGRLERRFNFRVDLAQAMENHGWSRGLASIMAGSGAKYSWKGLCESAEFDCSVPQAPYDRPYGIFQWEGPDGQRILTKWQKMQRAIFPGEDGSRGPGGYAEARYPREAIPRFIDSAATSDFYLNYPFPDVTSLFGAGWDDAEWIIPLTDPRAFPTVARDFTRPDRRVIVSNFVDYFRDFSATYNTAALPVQKVSYGNDWEVQVAAFAAKAGRVKRAIEQLRSAEAMATLVSLADPAFMNGRDRQREDSFTAIGLFFEHNVGSAGVLTAAQRLDYQERQARAVEAYPATLFADARAALGRQIPAAADRTRLYVFNPLGWARTDIAEAAAPGSAPVHIVDLATGKQVTSETIESGAERRLRFIAPSVPSLGYKVFEVREGPGTGGSGPAATFSAGTLQSALYRVTIDKDGEITSLVDRKRANREMIRLDTVLGASFGANSFSARDGVGSVALERAGPVSATVRATMTGAFPRTVRVTLFRTVKRVEIENTIDRNFDDFLSYSFPFNLDAPLVRHGETGAVLRARIEPDGDYTSRTQSQALEWLTLNHFAHMANGTNSNGMILSAADSYFFRLGNSTMRSLDTQTPFLEVLAAGRANGIYSGGPGSFGLGSLPNQGGDSAFRFAYALQPTAAYSQTEALRMALEHQNPLVTGEVTGGPDAPLPAATHSLLKLSSSNLFVWAVKPAEEGIGRGVIVRVWNQSPSNANFTPSVGAPFRLTAAAARTTHVETDLAGAQNTRVVSGNAIATFRLPVSR